jgi:signal peptidase I
MEPTLHANQLVLVSRFADRPERNEFWVGEINGFESIKRVVGLPGEFIEVRNNGVYVNGVLSSPHFDTPDNWYEVQLNDDEYFLVGDNRAHSSDSILFGPVSSGDLRGRLIYY